MAVKYEINGRLESLPDDQPLDGNKKIVEALCENEFKDLGNLVNDDVRDNITSLLKEDPCYVNEYSDYIIGSFAIPDKENVGFSHSIGAKTN